MRVVDELNSGKGRATPSRKEAEAARKAQMKVPLTRREQAKRDRAARDSVRQKQNEALRGGGSDKYLPVRDRGPVRRLCRDWVDRRRNIAEFLLPVLLLILILTFVQAPWAVSLTFALWTAMILGTVVDEIALVIGLRREIRRRFTPADVKGTTAYSVLRSTQMRRFRLPKPQIARGAPLPERY